MTGKKSSGKPHKRSAKAAEKKFGVSARKAAEKGGKKPKVWTQAEQSRTRLPGSAPLGPPPAPIDPFEPVAPKFEATVSHTIEAPVSLIYRAFNDTRQRGWCHERGYAVRGTVAPRSLILGFADGTTASVLIARKGNARSAVTVLQRGFPDATRAGEAREAWRWSLERLAAMMAE